MQILRRESQVSWKREVDEIARRKKLAAEMGGAESVARHRAAGKLTVRERVERLLDSASFAEIGALTGSARYDEAGNLTGFTPANVVIGTGRIGGRPVVLAAEDFTIRGGSSEASVSDKWVWAENLALEMRLPMVRLVDMAGGSVKLLEQMGATKLPGYPAWRIGDMLGTVPVVAAALGSVAGLGPVRVILSHFSVMVKETSQLFAAGPAVVARATGEKVTKEELGGAAIHARSTGVVDNEAESEEDAFGQLRRFLSYLPQSAYEIPPRQAPGEAPDRREEDLLSIIPRDRRRPYDARRILELVLDRESLFEIGRFWGRGQITMLGRLDEKLERFVDVCDTFHLPVVNFVDQPGMMVGTAAEKQATLRRATRALCAIEQSRVPWIAIIVRRVFGAGGAGYGRQRDLNLRYAWPSGYWGSIPIEGGVEAAHRRELEAAADPPARLAELEARYQKFASPFRTAERFGVHDIIDPRETRPLLCAWVSRAYATLPPELGPVRRFMRP
jgi:acetyl-CoA carboxylase carboxyltransferase component